LAILLGIPPERIVVTWLVGGWPLKRVRSLKGVKFETVLSFRGMEWTHTFFFIYVFHFLIIIILVHWVYTSNHEMIQQILPRKTLGVSFLIGDKRMKLP
jgi:hypothetical protein